MDRRRFLATAGAAAAGVGLGMQGAWGEPHRLEVTRHEIRPPSPPSARSVPLTVAQITDLHLNGLGEVHRRLARAVAEARPDLVLLTGDSVDREDALPLLDGFLAMLDPVVPKHAILGNWEHWSGVDRRELARVYARWNARLLVNETAVVRLRGRTLAVTGLDDATGGHPDLGAALRGVEPGPAHLLLAHSPGFRDLLAAAAGELRVGDTVLRPGVDLAAYRFMAMISGHTHGGQVAFGGWAPVLPPGSGRYARGWYRDGAGPPLYVSRGIGTSVLPVRLGSVPELAVFTVRV
jgi:predicted MPP superfamily phosphohydrolase